MARLFELLCVAILVYIAYRRVAAPLQRGYAERERERAKEAISSVHSKLDRTSVRDAEFKDLS